MKVGLLTQWYDPEPGPAGLPGALARGLAAQGHEVEVLTGFPNYPEGRIAEGYAMRPKTVETMDGVRVTRTALYPSHGDSVASRILNYGSFGATAAALGVSSAFRDIDALWVNYSPVTVALPMLAQHRFRHTPSVVHVLDLWPDTLTATGFGGSGVVSRVADAALTKACDAMYDAASRVAYISPGVGEVLAERGVAERKLAYAPMWANEDVFRPIDRNRNDGETDDRHVTLLYAGALGRAQGLDTLIRASAALRDQPFTCLIAGSGTEEERLKDLARRAGADNIHFLGRVHQSEVPMLMAKADVNYVSLNDDPLSRITMPSKMQAILATGGPIVGALTGDAAETVEMSGAGWTCPPGDHLALENVLRTVMAEGPRSIETRRHAARDYYEREFSLVRGVARIEDLLMGAVEERR